MMNIYMASILNFNEDTNGVVVSALELSEELTVAGNHVRIITPYHSEVTQLTKWLLRRSGELFKFSRISTFFLLNMLIKMSIILRAAWKGRKDVDVFHAHDFISATVFRLVRSRRQRLILHAHFNGSPCDEFITAGYFKRHGWMHKLFNRTFMSILRSSGVSVVAVSEHNRQIIQKLKQGQGAEPFVLYPGIRPAIKEKDEPTVEPYIISVGRLESRKNQAFAIDLLLALRKLNTHPRLVLVGPEDREYRRLLMEKVTANNLETQVIFLGQLSREKTRDLISQASLYLHTATDESFGRVIVEAMSSNTVVVSHEYPALKEIIDETAVIRSQDPLEKVAAFVQGILEDPLQMHSIQERQFARYHERFTPQQMIKNYEHIINTPH